MANTTGRKPHKAVAHTDSPSSYALLLSGCTNYAFYIFYARRNRRNSPSMARFLLASASMPRHFCALQHNSTDTKQLRYSPTRQYRLPNHRLMPLTLRYNVLVLTCGSDGTALSACMWEAPILRCFPLDTLYSPDGMQCVLKKIMNCHEVPYSLITQKAPAYPQSISTWARG